MLVYLIKELLLIEMSLIEFKGQRVNNDRKQKKLFSWKYEAEIKTPLNAIYGFTEQILSGELKPEQEQQLKIVKASAAHQPN